MFCSKLELLRGCFAGESDAEWEASDLCIRWGQGRHPWGRHQRGPAVPGQGGQGLPEAGERQSGWWVAVLDILWLPGLPPVKSIFPRCSSRCGLILVPWRSFLSSWSDGSLLLPHGWFWILSMDSGPIWTTQKFHRVWCVQIRYLWPETKADNKYQRLRFRPGAACKIYSSFPSWIWGRSGFSLPVKRLAPSLSCRRVWVQTSSKS